MLQRNLVIVAMMVLAAIPAASAHFPPRPVIVCQDIAAGDGKYHDYLPPITGHLVLGGDGNLNNCPKPNPIELGLGFCIPPADTIPVVCDPVNTGVEQPLLDYDGELDYGHGGVFLFVRSGDGMTDGTVACFGWPSLGHHSTTIYAFDDVTGIGPTFSVTSDHSRAGLEENPDCGDNYVEPCDPLPPEPSGLPFPLNLVADELNRILYEQVFGPNGEGCNPLDNAYRCLKPNGEPNAPPKNVPNRCTVPFNDGADGALVVFIENDDRQPHFPQGGHVWTT